MTTERLTLALDQVVAATQRSAAECRQTGRRVVSAFITTAFAWEAPEAASTQWRAVADQIRPMVPKLAVIMDDAEPDALAYMTFPKEHRGKPHSSNQQITDARKRCRRLKQYCEN